jgi:hypothetical protein
LNALKTTPRLRFQQDATPATAKGQLTQLIWVAQRIEWYSPAAAVAITDFLAKQTSEIQGNAHAERTRLLEKIRPSAAARHSASNGRRYHTDTDGQQTNQLAYLEVVFLGIVHNEPWANGIDRVKLRSDLLQLAGSFHARGEQKREASTRFILADLYLQAGHPEDATREMGKAIVLASVAYASRDDESALDQMKLVELTTGALGQSIIDETYQAAPDDTRTRAMDSLVTS